MSKIRAFIDLGTNTFHLLIAEIKGGKSSVLFRTREIVGLGAGGINDDRILPEAFDRGMHCLRGFKEKCIEFQVEEINAFGTSALRNASNSQEFIDKVNIETGIKIEIIDGDREAELIQLGISSALEDMNEPYLIMDIGGGSTEFILVQNDELIMKRSFEVGVQRLLSSFFIEDPISKSSYQDLNNYLTVFLAELSEFKEYSPKILVGASGTYTTLYRMFIEANDIIEPANTKVPIEFFNSAFQRIIHSRREERLQLPGMSPPRVDLIVVGSCLVDYAVKLFDFDGFIVSGNGLKEGAMLLASKGKI